MEQVIHSEFPEILIEHTDLLKNPEVYLKRKDTNDVLAEIICNGVVTLAVKEPLFDMQMDFEKRQKLYIQIFATAHKFSVEFGKNGHFNLHFEVGGAINPQTLSQLLSCTTPQLRSLYQ